MAPWVTQAVNDKQQVVPVLERLRALPTDLIQVEQALVDTGYFGADNVAACEQAGIKPLIAMGRDAHHPHWSGRFSEVEASTNSGRPGMKSPGRPLARGLLSVPQRREQPGSWRGPRAGQRGLTIERIGYTFFAMQYIWDNAKRRTNLAKHGLDFASGRGGFRRTHADAA